MSLEGQPPPQGVGDDEVLRLSVEQPAVGAVVVTLGGELDVQSAAGIADCLRELVAGNDVVVDLTDLRFVDAAGVGALMKARNQARPEGRTMTLRRPRPNVLRTLEVAGVDNVFPIEP